MFLLRNNEQFNDIATYDAHNRSWRRLDSESRKEVVPADISGFFTILSSEILCDFSLRTRDNRVRRRMFKFHFRIESKLAWRSNPNKRRLTISLQDAKVIVNHEYSPGFVESV